MLIYLQMIDEPEERSKFVELYELYKGLMFYVANKLLHNEADAEDAVHQAFLSIIKNIKKISDVGCPQTRSLIVIIVERKAIDILRARNRAHDTEYEDAVGGIEFPMPGDGGLADAISRLPARYREALFLHYVHGYSTKEIADMFGMKTGAVQKLIWRAKNSLKEILEKEGMMDA